MKLLRKLLFPFSVIYWAITALRNKFYDLGWLESRAYNIPIICVGNLSTGGTGKSPMIEFLIASLKDDWKLGVLSRGYKRKTKGFVEVKENSTVSETGDEPLQFKRKFPNVTVAVCEDRQRGIGKLLETSNCILLDDAFQHRKVRASTNILLSTYDDLYVDDYILPMGNLRESKAGAARADAIVVTKCPSSITTLKREEIKRKLKPKAYQKIYFTKIGYAKKIVGSSGDKSLGYLRENKFTLVTGIANPQPLLDHLRAQDFIFEHKPFGDHHNFTASEISTLEKEDLLLTTEKDFMRLQPLIKRAQLYYLPITTEFVDGKEEEFLDHIIPNG